MTQAMFSQITLENPSGRYHIEDQHRVFHDDGYSQFLLQTFKKIFLWLNNRNIWLVYFFKIKRYIKYKNCTRHNKFKLTISSSACAFQTDSFFSLKNRDLTLLLILI